MSLIVPLFGERDQLDEIIWNLIDTQPVQYSIMVNIIGNIKEFGFYFKVSWKLLKVTIHSFILFL